VFPNVAISGAPVSLLAGTSARLFASVTAEDPYVRWKVDGVDSGSPETGFVDATGLYIAPATAPPAGQVVIRATTASGVFDEVTIQIQDPPLPQPAPSAAAAGAPIEILLPPSGSAGATNELRAFGGVRLASVGGALVVTTRSVRTGVARVRVRTGDRLLGKCLVRATRGRSLSCRVPLPSGVSADDVRVVMTFRVRGRLVQVRRFRPSPAELHSAHGTHP
jgi:hypothetical protein